jgi:hypothetical protein
VSSHPRGKVPFDKTQPPRHEDSRDAFDTLEREQKRARFPQTLKRPAPGPIMEMPGHFGYTRKFVFALIARLVPAADAVSGW